MFAIHTYTDTKSELEIAKTRLRFLKNKQEKLFHKYFPITSKSKEIVIDVDKTNKEKMADYLHELYEIDIGTGKSLGEELEYQEQNVIRLQGYLDDMTVALSNMNGIEHKLYYEVVVNGLPVTKAVEKVAEISNKDTGTIWKNYYRKIKKEIKKITKYSNKA